MANLKNKADDIIIYKQDIMDDDGKLNTLGALLLIGTVLICFNKALEYLQECIVDKDKIN